MESLDNSLKTSRILRNFNTNLHNFLALNSIKLRFKHAETIMRSRTYKKFVFLFALLSSKFTTPWIIFDLRIFLLRSFLPCLFLVRMLRCIIIGSCLSCAYIELWMHLGSLESPQSNGALFIWSWWLIIVDKITKWDRVIVNKFGAHWV